MEFFTGYNAYVISGYAIAAIVIAALTVHIWLDMRCQESILCRLKVQGVPRRGTVHTDVSGMDRPDDGPGLR